MSRGLIEADASSTPSFVNCDAILSGDDACSLTLLTKSDPPVSLLRSASSLSSTSSSAPMGEPGTVILPYGTTPERHTLAESVPQVVNNTERYDLYLTRIRTRCQFSHTRRPTFAMSARVRTLAPPCTYAAPTRASAGRSARHSAHGAPNGAQSHHRVGYHREHHLVAPLPIRVSSRQTTDRAWVRCAAVSAEDEPPSSSGSTAAATYTERAMTPKEAWRRMWTKADRYHVHGLSGAAFTLLGGGVLGAWAKRDLGALGVIDDSNAAEMVRDAVQNGGGSPEYWGVAVFSLLLAGVCAVSGTPLGTKRGWRKVELSARSTLFQLVLTWQALRLGPGGESLAFLDDVAWPLALSPFIWQCVTSAYIITATKDDKRSAVFILIGAWLFGAQVFPAASVIALPGGVTALSVARPGLVSVWTHSLLGLVWLLNWSTLGASMRARKVIDDNGYRSGFLLRPSAAWIALFALDVAAYAPFASVWEYLTSAGGSRGLGL